MARTIAEIKQQMTDAYMSDTDVLNKYGLPEGAQFDEHFSKVSLESLIFYITAVAVWTLEKIFDTHKADVEEALEARQPCTARWYRDQILALRDQNDAPYATACSVCGEGQGILVKVQQGAVGSREQCSQTQIDAIRAWLAANHEAGVPYATRSAEPDLLGGSVTVYYDPLVMDNPAGTVDDTLAALLSDIPYDGILSVNDITVKLLSVEGIRRVRLQNLTTARHNGPELPLNVQASSYSGSWKLGSGFTITCTPYTATTI